MPISYRGLALGIPYLSDGAASLTYLLRDEFVTAESAPLTSPRTAEPGPGTLTVTDASNKLSITGGKLVYAGGATADVDVSSPSFASRVVGEAIYANFTFSTTNNDMYFLTQAGQITNMVRWFGSSIYAHQNTNLGITYATATPYSFALVLRTAGSFAMIKGGAFTSWTLLWVADSVTTAPSPRLDFNTSTGTNSVDALRVADLPSPWDTDYGIATTRLAGARSAGDTFTHTADALIEFTVTTLPSSGQAEVFFRVQDASNYWAVTVDSTGALDLDEVVAGSPTQRGTSAAAVSNGSRVVVVAAGTTIKVYVDNGLDINYTSASNFQTETAGELDTEGTGGSVSDIVAWPRTLSGSAASALNKL